MRVGGRGLAIGLFAARMFTIAAARAVGPIDVGELQGRLAEQRPAPPWFSRHQQLALDGGDGRGRDVAVLGAESRRRCPTHRSEAAWRSFRSSSSSPSSSAALEAPPSERPPGRPLELQHPRDQQRSHFGDRGADRVGLARRTGPRRPPAAARGFSVRLHGGGPGLHLLVGGSGRGHHSRIGRLSRRRRTPALRRRTIPRARICRVTVLPVPVVVPRPPGRGRLARSSRSSSG